MKKEIQNLILERCYITGKFKLHSGQISSYIFDILQIVNNDKFIKYLLEFFSDDNHLVGIEFGGSIIAALSGKPFTIIRKDGTIYGKIPNDYTLVDDVVTTQSSIEFAISKISIKPTKIKCIVDRRNHLNTKNIYDIDYILKF